MFCFFLRICVLHFSFAPCFDMCLQACVWQLFPHLFLNLFPAFVCASFSTRKTLDARKIFYLDLGPKSQFPTFATI